MDAAQETRLLLQEDGDQQDASLYTGDGSVDIKGCPATRHDTGNWRACVFILGNECCERLAYYGIAKNLVTYLKIKLHQGNLEAARNVTTWQGTCYLSPLIGAILADSYWGKYWTIAVFSSIYFIGLAVLTLSASLPALQPPSCLGNVCPEPSLLQNGTFFLGLYMIALGTGGIKPCVSSFGADQFDDSDPTERVKQGSFFNWFYFCINIGAFISGTVIVWIQDNSGWGIGFAIPTIFMALAIASFFSASDVYRFQKPGGSPLTRVCQVVVSAFRKWHVELPRDTALLYEVDGQNSAIEGSRKLEHTTELEFLDKAAIISSTDAKSDLITNPWRLCTVTQVEELKILVRMFPVWATTIIFNAVYAQNSSMFLEQGMVLDKRVGSFNVPPASLSSFDVISVMIWVPLYDRVLIPIARKFTGREKGFSELQRIGIGLVLSIIAMVSAAFVELKRLEIATSEGLIHEKSAVPMSILWQIPQYFLVGAAEVFTNIGLLEFSYDQAPDAMRSLCAAFALITVSAGSYLSSFILTLVSYITTQGGDPGWIPDNLNEGHLDRFFWLIAGISFVNLLVYISCAMKYKYKNV
ncbi:protein NRT1/ PTR FAMILY 8.3-like isoform X1 [Triticum dicoccoides]|uniref:protein NRT1/ PTR FAMILY 8.3-like isoform X1 n=1 Tax=Triticum dicoccoides TaxID=85692 RepID=UPI00188EF53B|nr:protein NRT1/ PTR FAMILY 8.3-like isoform X1 [Triticum dicoccoides]